MILKNFINLFNMFYLTLFILFIFLINKFLLSSKIRNKFFLMLVLLFLLSFIGFYYSLDGIVLMFLISELSLILIFITMFSQLYTHNKENIKQKSYFYIIIILIFNYGFYQTNIITYKNYYSHYSININDFYYIYNCYFEKQIILTIITLFIITLYSIFFILLYYNLKKNVIEKNNLKKNIFLLRKQNIIHQANYNSKIRFFKNN